MEVRAALAPLRKYVRRNMTGEPGERERRCIVAAILTGGDYSAPARAAGLCTTREPIPLESLRIAAQHVLRRPHVQVLYKALLPAVGADRVKRSVLIAKIAGALDRAYRPHEIAELAKIAIMLDPTLRQTTDGADSAVSLARAEELLAQAERQGIRTEPHGGLSVVSMPTERDGAA